MTVATLLSTLALVLGLALVIGFFAVLAWVVLSDDSPKAMSARERAEYDVQLKKSAGVYATMVEYEEALEEARKL